MIPELDKRYDRVLPVTPQISEADRDGSTWPCRKATDIIVRDECGNVAKVESTMPLAMAEKLPLTKKNCVTNLAGLAVHRSCLAR